METVYDLGNKMIESLIKEKVGNCGVNVVKTFHLTFFHGIGTSWRRHYDRQSHRQNFETWAIIH